MISDHQTAAKEFPGFEPLTANYLYCPNQFFDVCMPHYSRGVVRLVAYLLRRTLGWLDESGSPIEQDISVSYMDLITKARIGRSSIAQAINDAISGGFIVCKNEPRPKSHSKPAETAQYTLRWNDDPRYITDPTRFVGFFAGEGNRTPIPIRLIMFGMSI